MIDNNVLLLNCIDGKSNNKICIENIKKLGYDCLVGKITSRNIAYIILPNNISVDDQEKNYYYF